MMYILQLVAYGLWLWMVVDFVQRRAWEDSLWTVVVFLSPLGALAYFIFYYFPQVNSESKPLARRKEMQQLEAVGEAELPAGQLRNLGDIYFGMDRWEDALRCYQRAIVFCGDQYVMRLNMAICLVNLGRGAEAIPELDRVAEQSPQYRVPALLAKGRAFMELNRMDEALGTFEAASRGASSYEASYHHGLCLSKMGRNAEAKKALCWLVDKRALASKRDRPWIREAERLLKKMR